MCPCRHVLQNKRRRSQSKIFIFLISVNQAVLAQFAPPAPPVLHKHPLSVVEFARASACFETAQEEDELSLRNRGADYTAARVLVRQSKTAVRRRQSNRSKQSHMLCGLEKRTRVATVAEQTKNQGYSPPVHSLFLTHPRTIRGRVSESKRMQSARYAGDNTHTRTNNKGYLPPSFPPHKENPERWKRPTITGGR
ncbi:unnamed protein product [Ectocarpus fasciculatus]